MKNSENLSIKLSPFLDNDQQQQKQKIFIKHQQSLTSDLYYCLGEHIDALDDDTAAWFPATIAAIIEDENDDNNNNNNNSVSHTYFVTFCKPSLGGRVPRRLSQIRPPSSKPLNSFDILSPGQAVLVLVEPVRTWQVGLIEQTIRDFRYSKKKSAGKVVISLVMGVNSNEGECDGGGTVVQQYVHQFKAGTLLELQSNVLRTERSPELEEVLRNGLPSGSSKYLLFFCTQNTKPYLFLGFYEPDCSACDDDPSFERCTFCGCSVCSLKSRPEAQLLCDECDRPTHLECLAKPLAEVPNDTDEEDWYCDQCRTESAEKVRQKQRDHLKSRKKGGRDEEEVVRSNWGFGMSTAKRSSPASQPQFGAIEGVPVGAWWRFRVQASAAGVHRPLVAGVDGSLKYGGVYSIVFSGTRTDDVDLGEELYFSPTREQQSRALALNCSKGEKGRPVRVLRSGNGRSGQRARSLYLPKVGVRYDGLYRVVRFWREEDSGQWRFYLKRDDPAPAPWTEAGRYQARKTGYQAPRYPDGWTTEMAGKRRLTVDLKMVERAEKRVKKEITLDKNKQKFTVAWSIPAAVEALIEQDTLPISRQKQWDELRQLARESGKEVMIICSNSDLILI